MEPAATVSFGNILGSILMIGIIVGMFFVVRTVLLFCVRRGWNVLGILITILTFPVLFIGPIAYISVSVKLSKERALLYSEIAAMPSDKRVDELIAYINKYGCVNDPQSWNQLRAVWFAINDSSNVTTEKKNEVKSFLMLRGLAIHHNDAKVKNNYRR